MLKPIFIMRDKKDPRNKYTEICHTRPRFRSLCTTLPDMDGNSRGFHLPFDVLETYDPADENAEVEKMHNDLVSRGQMTVKGRFRRIVKSLILHNRWSNLIETKHADAEVMTKLKDMESQKNPDTLTFNPGAFRSNYHQVLRDTEKLILRKPSWKRTEEELHLIYKSIDTMLVFKKYQKFVKQELTRSLHYEQYEDGRIIIQQGHIGMSLYFIIKGSVAVEVATVDKESGTIYKQIVNEIMAGASFGEMALMSGMVRAATVICIGQSEFLRIDKNDFNHVLMRSYQKEYELKRLFLSSCQTFSDWSVKELKAAVATATIKEYLPNQVIVKDLKNHKGSINIIRSGTCIAVSKVKVLKENLPYGKTMLHMISKKSTTDKTTVPKKTKYVDIIEMLLTIRKLGFKDSFGIGEDLEDTSVVTMDKVEIITVPSVHLLRHARGRCLEELRKQEMKLYPTPTEAFHNFICHRKWSLFKEDIQTHIMEKKNLEININPLLRSFSPTKAKPKIFTVQVPKLNYVHRREKRQREKRHKKNMLTPTLRSVC